MATAGAISSFVNVASATADAAFTGGQQQSPGGAAMLPIAKTGCSVLVLAVVVNANTAADTVQFNSKPAGAGAAISALLSNPINGTVVLPYSPVGWFQTNNSEG